MRKLHETSWKLMKWFANHWFALIFHIHLSLLWLPSSHGEHRNQILRRIGNFGKQAGSIANLRFSRENERRNESERSWLIMTTIYKWYYNIHQYTSIYINIHQYTSIYYIFWTWAFNKQPHQPHRFATLLPRSRRSGSTSQVSEWLKKRLKSALSSNQPLETTVELVQQAKETSI